MTLSELVAYIRDEVDDDLNSRWSNAKVLRFLKRAVRRAADVVRKADVELGRTVYTFDTVAGTSGYALPADFRAPVGLYRTSQQAKLSHATEDVWNTDAQTAAEFTYWLIRDGYLYVLGTPSVVETLTFVYWSTPDTTGYTEALLTTTETPWGGLLDDILIDYAALRMKNVDEMDTTMDASLLQEFEAAVLDTFGTLSPTQVVMVGGFA